MPNARIDHAFIGRRKHAPSTLYWDDGRGAIKGFGLRTDRHGAPLSYVFQKSGGRRVAFARVDDMDLADARVEAKRLDADATAAVMRGAPRRRLTVREAMAAHVASMRARKLSERSIEIIEYETPRYAPKLMEKRLDRVTHDDIAAAFLHATEHNGPYAANRCVRHLRAIYGTANAPFPLGAAWWRAKKNPEDNSGKEPVRDLRALGARLRELENPVVADYWRFVLLTGLRREDALTVRWEDFDAKRAGWLFRPNPKGGPRRAFELPITKAVRRIVKRMGRDGEWFFAGHVHGQHLAAPEKPRVPTAHRLRATWATRAEELGCPIGVMAALLNHSVKSQSITLRYSTPSDDVIADWAERIAESLWRDLEPPKVKASRAR